MPRLPFIAALILVLIAAFSFPTMAKAQGFQVPRGTMIPPHVQQCMGDMTIYQGFVVYRLAGITLEEAKVSVGLSMKVIRYQVESSGVTPKRPINEVEADTYEKLEEVYAMDPFSGPVANAWASGKIQTCIDAAEKKMPKPGQGEDRMMRKERSA